MSGLWDEIRQLACWGRRHRQLIFRLTIILLLTLVIDALGTVAIYFFERDAVGTEIQSVGDALFFTTVQVLTVSSQLKNPLTTGGRVVDVFLEVWGVLVVAASAGSVTSFLLDSNT